MLTVSASKLSLAAECDRKFFFRYVQKIETPQTPAQILGEDIHSGVEHYLKTGKLPQGKIDCGRFGKRKLKDLTHTQPFVQSLTKILPPPKSEGLLIEHEFRVPLPEDKAQLYGFVDFATVRPGLIRINDLKTSSNLRYAKTPKELERDIQMVSYGKFGYSLKGVDPAQSISLNHVYCETKTHKTKLPNVLGPVGFTADYRSIDREWQKIRPLIGTVRDVLLATKAQDVLPTGTAKGICDKYGGCPYRVQCGIGSAPTVSYWKGNTPDMSFTDRLNQAKKTKKKGTLPPDAPSRTVDEDEEDETEEETAAAPKKRGRPKKVREEEEDDDRPAKKKRQRDDEDEDGEDEKPKTAREKIQAKARAVAEEEAEEEEEEIKKERKGKSRKPFHLFIDCIPTKTAGEEILAPTLFEDWIAPVIQDLNELAKEEKNLDSYLLLPFNEEKGNFQLAVGERALKDLPERMIVSSFTPGAREALGILKPYATNITQALRS